MELLRGSHSPVHRTLKALIEAEEQLAVTEVVVMELLAGVASERAGRELRSRLLAFELLATRGLGDFEDAAAIYRLCRRRGDSIRNMIDCLIAACALRHGATLLQRDSDFATIARHVPLRLYQT